MSYAEKPEIRSERRNGGSLHHLDVRNVYVFGNDECRCPHDRRHQLPVRAGGNLYCRCFLGGIAYFFHQGYGERSGGNDIGNAGAGNKTGGTARYNGSFCSTPLEPTEKGEGKVGEKFSCPRLIQ